MQWDPGRKEYRCIHKDKSRVCVAGPYCEYQLYEIRVIDHFLT